MFQPGLIPQQPGGPLGGRRICVCSSCRSQNSRPQKLNPFWRQTHSGLQKINPFFQKYRQSCNYSILYQKLGGHTVWGIRLLHCTRLLGTHGYLVGSGETMVSGNLPIESGRAQGCFFMEKWQSGILEANFRILEALRKHWGVLKAVFFFWKMAISDSGRPFWDSGSPF